MSVDLTRRDFLAALGGGVLVVCVVDDVQAQESGRRSHHGDARPQVISAWLHIGGDGAVTVFTGKAEMGQNIRTSLSQAVAEELHVPLEGVKLLMADTDRTPYDMGTFGSRTTPTMSPELRRAAAAAREAIIAFAASQWKVDRGDIQIADGRVTCGSHSAGIGELAHGQQLALTIDSSVKLTPATDWKIAGQSAPKVDARSFVTGAHRYASDIKQPGMLHGKILRPASFGATLDFLDAAAAKHISGVTVVHEGDFAGITAPDPASAEQALRALRAEWKTKPQPSDRELFDLLKNKAEPGEPRRVTGSIERGMAEADHKLSATYTVAYIAHVPLEPRASVAEWNGDKLTVWTGTQRPFGVRGELAEAFKIPEDQVHVIVPDTGSAYGGKHSGEMAVEAARLAKAAGKPVKLVWTREEEFTWAYFRPAGVIEVSSGVRSDGKLTAWEYHNYNSGSSALGGTYDIPNQRLVFHPAESPLMQGSYRGLAATANHFARESHMDELAHLVKIGPLEFRLKNLTDPRQRAVLQAATDKFGWGKQRIEPGIGSGLSMGFEKGGYVATCAEVAVEAGVPKIRRVVEAFECGAVVNPDHLRNQIEGAIIMGIGGALFERVRFDNGRILNPLLSRYRVPRFADVPLIETVLVDRKDLPSAGAGETPIVGIAPAVANAIFQATGKRLRSMPLTL
ncbi:MAG TPA: molybdopterin cofactor-binding domain-containing protein [Bryobacteraceae bacterium]|nr:molybdopterin cofactor-binding domain-containing protein [Bryobacteraceae bacterium]